MPEPADKMEKLISLCKRRGFVFPGSEIYGGFGSSYDYGPLGTALKNNVRASWWERFVTSRDDMVGLDSAIIMNPKVWEASGHVATFSDEVVKCMGCKVRYKVGEVIKCKFCDGTEFAPPASVPGMSKVDMGGGKDVYLRPETAQGIFVNYKNVAESMRLKPPFGIAQIGKAFRNEVTPGHFTFRTREFEQMEIEWFCEEKEADAMFSGWYTNMKNWLRDDCGLSQENLSVTEVTEADRAFYSKRTVDIEYVYPFGRKELCGLAYRGDYDLRQHQKASGVKLGDPLPHVIEPSFGLDRTVLAVLLDAYREEALPDGETRTVLRLPKKLAPYQAAVLPLSKQLNERARGIAAALRSEGLSVSYDDTQSIGKRYRRQDEIGTPYCVTYDFKSLEDGMVTVRDRDTMGQERVPVEMLRGHLAGLLK